MRKRDHHNGIKSKKVFYKFIRGEPKINSITTKSDGVVEYADCISTEEQEPHNNWPEYDTKQSDGETPGMELLEMWSTSPLPLLSCPLRP